MKKKLPILFLLIGALGFTSCGSSSNGLTPGKLPKGGTEITAEEMVTKINEMDTTYSDIEGYYCSLNIDDISYKANSSYQVGASDDAQEYKTISEFGLSGKFESAGNIIKSENNEDQINAYAKIYDFGFKYKNENTIPENTSILTNSNVDIDYSNMAVATYLTNDNLYVDLSNENTMKLIDDLTKDETTSITINIPSKFVIENISSLFDGILAISDDSSNIFDFTSLDIDLESVLVSLKEEFNESVSYQSFGENGFGIAVSISKEKMINFMIEQYVESNYGEDKTYESLTEAEKQVVLEYTNQFEFKAIDASIYFDGDNKVMELATNIDFSSNIKIDENSLIGNVTGTSQNALVLKISSYLDLKGREITFPTDLNEYQVFNKESFIF